jgi:hypothetical protein
MSSEARHPLAKGIATIYGKFINLPKRCSNNCGKFVNLPQKRLADNSSISNNSVSLQR